MKNIFLYSLILMLSTTIVHAEENNEYKEVTNLVRAFIDEIGNKSLSGAINFNKYCHPDFEYLGNDSAGSVISSSFTIENIKKEKGKYNLIQPDLEEELIIVTASFKVIGNFIYNKEFNFQPQKNTVKSIYYFSKSTGSYLILWIDGPVEFSFYSSALQWAQSKATEDESFFSVLESLKKVKVD